MGLTVNANDGAMLPLDSLTQTFAYDGLFLASISVTYQNNYYVQTFTNDGTNITSISGWINTIPPSATVMVTEDGKQMIMEKPSNPLFPTIMITE